MAQTTRLQFDQDGRLIVPVLIQQDLDRAKNSTPTISANVEIETTKQTVSASSETATSSKLTNKQQYIKSLIRRYR